ncbi:hypothetical protein CDV31_009249 [Fusarium ambrosium]|uniref:Uncharacterized protein n=1 Tax=Fusarium ambrosium TaxID=131363 RepID=A0A428TVW8_9HYPO|nr:hypothetical protein CDV31_009249 [Fusarium ambrosium]
MVNSLRLLALAATALTGLAPVTASPAPEPAGPTLLPGFEVDWSKWWTRQLFSCPVWKGPLPQSAQDLAGSTCNNAWTRTITGGSITARLYQVPGQWQKEPRYSEIVNGVADAIKKGVGIFGSMAGPLKIHIGFVSGVLGDIVQVDDNNSGTKDPCYMIIDFPPGTSKYPLLAIQKDVIKGMYQCVEQFHRPTVTTWTKGNEWWRQGIARYFDGLAYPTTNAIMNRGLYPEEYQFGIPLYQNDEAAALFFHFMDGLGGWSPTDVNNWMKAHPNKATYELERKSLWMDIKITSTAWHRFVLACRDQTIRYPNGQKIPLKFGGPPVTTHPLVNVAKVGGTYSKSVTGKAWKGAINIFSIKAGQKMRVTFEADPGIEWSIRKVGTNTWNTGARTRTVNIAAAPGAITKFELAVSSKRDDGGSGLSKVKMTRTA